MTKQIAFILILLITIGTFSFTLSRLIGFFKLTRPALPVKDFGKRLSVMLNVAFGQTKIFRKPVIGFFHALVFWGFCVIIFGSIEMVIDGVTGSDRVLKFFGTLYNIVIASGDIFGLLVAISIVIFLSRRLFFHIKRFEGIEMKKMTHTDANIALSMILLLMLSLLGMNAAYFESRVLTGAAVYGIYPVGSIIGGLLARFSPESLRVQYEVFWWMHIVLIFIFANMLPYSKHFHVFMSVPNVFLSNLNPLGKMTNMDNITREVKMMLNTDTAFQAAPADAPVERFGIKDVEDSTWKNYFDSLSCTQCGRCTEVCPANTTGKKLSPRKILMDVRARMNEKGPAMVKNGKDYADGKSLLRDYITEEELWACTTCNACATECPVNINHPSIILDMRRYLVMEEGSAPSELKAVFSNIENNGAPWQYSSEDRLNWTKDLAVVPVMADVVSKGEKPEYLFWVGCAGAFDDRYKKVVRAFAKILSHLNVSYAVLGKEESCTGDPARRAGNEMLYQMQALQNIEIFKMYDIKKIVTICPHCYNIFKNDYPDLGGSYEVINYIQFLEGFIESGKLKINQASLKNVSVTYHDPCYLGRANGIYDEPRKILKSLSGGFIEMERNKSFALCCGAGGGQMFKEAEKGNKEIFIERIEDALKTDAKIIASACPFCMTMLTDGLKYKNREEEIKNYDIAELIAQSLEL